MHSLLFQTILDQVTYVSFLHYYILTKSNDWGEIGQDHIQHSFSRLVCSLDSDEDVDYSILNKLTIEASNKIHALGIDTLSLEEAKEKYKQFQFTVDGIIYPLQHIDKLNAYIREKGELFFIQGGYYGQDIELILGLGDYVFKGDYILYTIKEEVFHTPNTIVPMAAVIGHKEIFVRERTLYIIFRQKWLPVSRYSSQPLSFFLDPISEKIKRKCISYYAESSLFYLKRDLFVKDLTSIVLQHECGHAVIQHYLLPQRDATFGESMKLFDENIITVLLEVLADLAPFHQEMHGPLQEMVKRSSFHQHETDRLFYMYLSDTYFYDTQDVHMYQYSDLITLIMGSVILETGQVDTDRLQTYLLYKEGSLLSLLLNLVHDCIDRVSDVVCSHCFDGDQQAFSLALGDVMSTNELIGDVRSYEYAVTQWSSFFTLLLETEPLLKQTVQRELEKLSIDVLRKVSVHVQCEFHFSTLSEYREKLNIYLQSKL